MYVASVDDVVSLISSAEVQNITAIHTAYVGVMVLHVILVWVYLKIIMLDLSIVTNAEIYSHVTDILVGVKYIKK